MDEVIMTYQPVEVSIGGEIVRVRPIAWDGEIVDAAGRKADGEYAMPILYESVCPKCGQMIHIANNLKAAKCPECGVGTDVKRIEDFISPFQSPGDYVPEEIPEMTHILEKKDDTFVVRDLKTNKEVELSEFSKRGPDFPATEVTKAELQALHDVSNEELDTIVDELLKPKEAE